MGFKYFIKHIFKIIILLISLGLCSTFSVGDGNWIGGVFLFILLFVEVSSTYDLGDGWFLKVTTGAGIGGAFLGCLVVVLALSWIEEFIHIVKGILLLSYVINQIIETFKYAREIPKFFTITGIFCVVMFAIEAVRAFGNKESFLLRLDSGYGSDDLGVMLLLLLTALFTLVNIIARATKANRIEY